MCRRQGSQPVISVRVLRVYARRGAEPVAIQEPGVCRTGGHTSRLRCEVAVTFPAHGSTEAGCGECCCNVAMLQEYPARCLQLAPLLTD